jgi:hypothetical protein
MRANLDREIAAEKSAADARRRQQIAEAEQKAQHILDGSTAQEKIAAEKISAGPLLASNAPIVSNAPFSRKPVDPNDPNAPFHISGSTAAAPSAGTDTNAMRTLKGTNSNSTQGADAGPGDTEADRGKDLTGKTIDTAGKGPAKDPDPPPLVTPHAEPVLTPEQQARLKDRLAKNEEYQQLLAKHGQAVKDAAKAKDALDALTAKLDALTAKYAAMPNSPAKSQAAVEVANASQEVTRTSNALADNEKGQERIKEEEVEITIVPRKPKPKPVEPPLPGTLSPANPAAGSGSTPAAGPDERN